MFKKAKNVTAYKMLPIAYYILYVFINKYVYIGEWCVPVTPELWMLRQEGCHKLGLM